MNVRSYYIIKTTSVALLWGAAVSFLMLPGVVCAQNNKNKEEQKAVEQTTPEKRPDKKEDKDQYNLPAYEKIITSKAKTDDGLFKVHKLDDKYYFEIPDSLLGREILVVTRIAKTANGIGYGGEELHSQVIRWVKKEKKIFCKEVSYNNVASDSLPVAKSVNNSNFEPILVAFDIKTFSRDSGNVIEVSNLLLKDVPALGLDDARRKLYKVTGLDENRTYIESIKSFPTNIEARSVVTYKASEAPNESHTGTISLEINNSFVLLSKVPMKPRVLDKRVGYFSVSQIDFGRDEQRADLRTYIMRYRLEPKDVNAYKRGELVEPKKKIIYYIDPATPTKWVKYLKQGVEDWNVAFERAGFKNVMVAKDAPTNDPDWSPEDVRYSVIRYFASKTENAYGPRVCDPRSGEIIESDVGWYHNIMRLLHDWYFVQTAAVNPKARAMKLDDDVMGALIRMVVAHEIGHTLGLPHNMGASYAYPVDSLRSASFTKRNGITTSIMDYVRFNYVAQPGDTGVTLLSSIGEYDKFSIQWGYSYLPDLKSVDDENETLNRWITEKADNPVYFFGRHSYNPIDPRSQTEDLGDNAMKASAYGMSNLKHLVPNLIAWSSTPAKDYSDLQELYDEVVMQWNRYSGQVRANIGGVYENLKSSEQAGSVYTPVPKEIQHQAMAYLQREAFLTPTWLLDQAILRRLEHAGAVERIRNSQSYQLNALLDPSRLARLIEAEAMLGKNTYTMLDLFTDLRKSIWSELQGGKPIDVYRRNLQRAHLEKLDNLLCEEQTIPLEKYKSYSGFTPININQSDVRMLVRVELKAMKIKITQALSITSDPLTKYHLQDCAQRIKVTLESKEN